MDTACIPYKIATVPPCTQIGHALALPEPWSDLRLCVREDFFSGWALDHFDSGMRVTILEGARTLNGAIKRARAWLKAATPEQLDVLRGDWRTWPPVIDYHRRLTARGTR